MGRDSRSDPLAGKQYGEFLLQTPIGVGPHGRVYRAQNTATRHRIQVKIVQVDVTRSPGFTAQIEREIDGTGRAEISGLARPLALASWENVGGLVSETVAGYSVGLRLLALAQSGQRPALLWAIRQAAALASILNTTHEAGLTHGDLHPGNVVLAHGDRPMLLDLGFARALVAGDFVVSERYSAYRAPEWAASPLDSTALDIFALGAMFSEMVLGQPIRPPWDPSTPWLAVIDPQLPAALDDILRSAMALSPGDRPSAATLAATLNDLESQLSADARLAIPRPAIYPPLATAEPPEESGETRLPIIAKRPGNYGQTMEGSGQRTIAPDLPTRAMPTTMASLSAGAAPNPPAASQNTAPSAPARPTPQSSSAEGSPVVVPRKRQAGGPPDNHGGRRTGGSASRGWSLPPSILWGGFIALGLVVLVILLIVAVNTVRAPSASGKPTATVQYVVFVPTAVTQEAIPPTLTSVPLPTATASPAATVPVADTATPEPPTEIPVVPSDTPVPIPPTASPTVIAPTASFTAKPAVMFAGDTATLSWSVSNAQAVLLDGAGVTGTGIENVTPATTQTYNLKVIALDGTSTTYQATVNIAAVSFSADPTTISPGESSTLAWNVSNANTVFLDGAGVAGQSSQQVSPTTTTTYNLVVNLSTGESKTFSVTVTVNQPPTNTAAPPTNTSAPPTDTPAPPTDTPAPPTNTPMPPTVTQALPTATHTSTPPTATAPAPATATPILTSTATRTSAPTNTIRP